MRRTRSWTEHWIQKLTKGAWEDTGGQQHSEKEAVENIQNLKRCEPKGRWRYVERTITDRFEEI